MTTTTYEPMHTEMPTLRFITLIAPMLGGFALGAGIGVLLWHLI